MKSIRIGNDITINWTIKKNGGLVILNDKAIRVFMTHAQGREEVDRNNISHSDSLVTIFFPGELQRVLGPYTLTIDVRKEDGGRFMIQDKCRAFALVGRSCCAIEDEDNSYLVTL